MNDAVSIAENVLSGKVSAVEVTQAALARIAARNNQLNCFTTITATTALKDAENIDKNIAEGKNIGVLCGVPFAVKNLFDIAGLTTLAGSKINAENPPATEDATAITRLKKSGAVLVGALNMDEYAYGFVTENAHYGTTHNPHDLQRVAGGSSGGSAAAVAGGLVPLTLGSDTNGSIRVPAALCGVFGFKPTYGRLSRAGVKLFSSSLDHIGHFATSVRDIATIFDVLQGEDGKDPICTKRPAERSLLQINNDISHLRIAIADDYFTQNSTPEALAAVQKVAKALNITQYVNIPEADIARAAAFVITACEGANLHLEKLKSRPQDFDVATRDRFLAGALIPGSWYIQAQRFRRWYRDQIREIFQNLDIIIAPTTPITSPLIGQQTMILDSEEILVRPHLGLFTQPLSFIGLPVLSVPIQNQNSLPLGVQLIAAPDNEVLILQIAAVLESQGVVSCQVSI
ncbi:Asp-tRNA(Asn)/Glu-tRNA(Gln) amidotransferase GatCAB subunit A [Anabaena cylindrica FACHB-243]|uniref:Amidohydrolase, AtzE family n=1 Tax=Anabaena cylindrica (strain ATCC 27899 / PCC 7122) TaxID=272123 RepID=K9ZLR6_ANACC|nr:MULTISPECIES: Asp-tRNA(Asn)/Glu-tRNA(Gln) amidotransferase GatCAB subunit A [Anabaena]AFZ59724.1 amidohydrolase, AtzE family [Anabaena cylindrica PCC 7122]MBD2418615.1 Asp-tRNA(Asn)/Glu-tRNA(Gln) amidotransferase GatCAB subunit A [Anabaena cylindrica FACHB-243]MBY5283358.1 Asp-tRNA(Asn)/Glu-tRNA(Gln) amidotransferase GatCAB subunit A [Anabaena sp. CCAP 1446/1C]MBY5307787.1 Asp-tRNA(Asn)/Glu-tRNA(Gln) amidotransferase GatCAB subunit A [Anabaena sp. CCAP 1446/1C]MCM2406175.1 Asp-tRNA(Asn)/Glu